MNFTEVEEIKVLALENVSKRYHMGHISTLALNSMNLTLLGGEFVTITGASGAGKSTLLNLAGLITAPDEGDVLIAGQSTKALSEKYLARLRNEYIGYVFQRFNLLKQYSVLDNVALVLRYRGLPRISATEQATQILVDLGLENRLRHLPGQLSGGQQQRVAIARALVGAPKLIVADEPTGNLDSTMASSIVDIFAELNQTGIAVLLVTHDRELARLGDRQITIRDGEIFDG